MSYAGGYAFAAAPRAVAGVATMEQDASSLSKFKRTHPKLGGNIMYDRRVVRGSAFAKAIAKAGVVAPTAGMAAAAAAATRRFNHQNSYQSNIRTPSSQPQYAASSSANSDQVDDVYQVPRVATPPPVEGRTHFGIQTDPFLEDLRLAKIQADFETQTAPEMDLPSDPLFNPFEPIAASNTLPTIQVDATTLTDEADLFDFDLHVEPILNVVCENGLEQAMFEVLEEEELKEISEYAQEVAHRLGTAAADLQALRQRDARLARERQICLDNEAQRLSAEKEKAANLVSASVTKEMLDQAAKSAMTKLDKAGYFYDPTSRQIAQEFIPSVLNSVRERVKAHSNIAAYLDRVVLDALEHAVQRNAELRKQAKISKSKIDNEMKEISDSEKKELVPSKDGDNETGGLLDEAEFVMKSSTAALDSPDEVLSRNIPDAKQLYPHLARRTATPADLLRPSTARRRAQNLVSSQGGEVRDSGDRKTGDGLGLLAGDSLSTKADSVDDLARAVAQLSGASGAPDDGDDGGDDSDGDNNYDDEGSDPKDENASSQDERLSDKLRKKNVSDNASLRALESLSRFLGFYGTASAEGLVIEAPDSNEDGSLIVLEPHSSAAQATLTVGDVVLSIDGVKVNTPEGLAELLASKLPGDTLSLKIARNLGSSLKYRREQVLQVEVGSKDMSLSSIRRHRRQAGLPEHPAPIVEPLDAYHKLKQAVLARGFDAKKAMEIFASSSINADLKLTAQAMQQTNSAAYLVINVAPLDTHFSASLVLRPGDLILAVNDEPCEVSPTLLDDATTSLESETKSLDALPGGIVYLQILHFAPQTTVEERTRALELIRGGAATEGLIARLGSLVDACQISDVELELGAEENTQEQVRFWHSLASTDASLAQRLAPRPRVIRPPPSVEELEALARATAREELGEDGKQMGSEDESELDKLGEALSSRVVDTQEQSGTDKHDKPADEPDQSKSEALLTLRAISASLGLVVNVPSTIDVLHLREKRSAYFSRRAELAEARASMASKLPQSSQKGTMNDQPTPHDREVDQLIDSSIEADQQYEKRAEVNGSSNMKSSDMEDADEDAALLANFRGQWRPQEGDSADPPGVIISYLNPLGAAAHASLRPGDWITHANEVRMRSPHDLEELENMSLPGDIIHLKVIRALDGRVEHIFLEVHGKSQAYDQHAIRAARVRAGLALSNAPLFTSPKTATEVIQGLQVDLGLFFEPFGAEEEAKLEAEYEAKMKKRMQLRSRKAHENVGDISESNDFEETEDELIDLDEDLLVSEPLLSTHVVAIDADSSVILAGLKVGDTIVQIGSTSVGNSRDVSRALQRYLPGDQVSIFVRKAAKDGSNADSTEYRLLVELACKVRSGAAEKSRELNEISRDLTSKARTLVSLQFIRFLRAVMAYAQRMALTRGSQIEDEEAKPLLRSSFGGSGSGAALLLRGNYDGQRKRSHVRSRSSVFLVDEISEDFIANRQHGGNRNGLISSPEHAIAKLESLLSDNTIEKSERAKVTLERIPAWLGIDIALCNAGIYVARVDQRGGAIQAGLTEGDVITHVSDIDIVSSHAQTEDSVSEDSQPRVHALLDLIAQQQPGDFIKLRLLRATDSRPETVYVELAAAEHLQSAFSLSRVRVLRVEAGLPSAEEQIREISQLHAGESNTAIIATANRSPEMAKQLLMNELKATLGIHGVDAATLDFGDAGPQTGLYVEKVLQDGPAGRAGVAVGDMIVRVGDVSIVDHQEKLYERLVQQTGRQDEERPLAHEAYRDIVSKHIPGEFIPLFVLTGDGTPTPQPQVIQIQDNTSSSSQAESVISLQPAPVADVTSCMWAEAFSKSSTHFGGTPSVEQIRALRSLSGLASGSSQRTTDVLGAIAKQVSQTMKRFTTGDLSDWASEVYTKSVYDEKGLSGVRSSLDELYKNVHAYAVSLSTAQEPIDVEPVIEILRLLPPSLGCEMMFVLVPVEPSENSSEEKQEPELKVELQVMTVDRDGAAAQSEIIEGDSILSIDGVAVSSMVELRRLLAHRTVGDVAVVIVRRATTGELVEIPLELSVDTKFIPYAPNTSTPQKPIQFTIRMLRSLIGWPTAQNLRLLDATTAMNELNSLVPETHLEVAVTTISREAGDDSSNSSESENSSSIRGMDVLFVVGVEEGSAAEMSGVRQGDCIVAVNGIEFVSLASMPPEAEEVTKEREKLEKDDENEDDRQEDGDEDKDEEEAELTSSVDKTEEPKMRSHAERVYVSAVEALVPGDPLILEIQPPGESGPFTLYLPTSARTTEGVLLPPESLHTLRRIAGRGAAKVRVISKPIVQKKAEKTDVDAAMESVVAEEDTYVTTTRYEASSETAEPLVPFVSETGYTTVSYATIAEADDLLFSEDVAVAIETKKASDAEAEDLDAEKGSAEKSQSLYSDPHRVAQVLSRIRPDFGVLCQELDSTGLPVLENSSTRSHQLQVVSVAREGGAVAATIVPGDLILSINGRELHSLRDLRTMTSKLSPGSLAHVEVRRAWDSRIESLTVEIGTTQPRSFSLLRMRALRASVNLPIPDFPVLLPSTALDALRRIKLRLGFVVADSVASDDSKSASQVSTCIVRRVSSSSSAQASGLRSGDAIVGILTDGIELPVRNVNVLYRSLQAYCAGDELKLRVLRSKTTSMSSETNLILSFDLGGQSATTELIASLRTIAGLEHGQRTPLTL